MTKIVALVDGSIYAQSVCDHAAWIAGRSGLPVEVLHVLGRRQTAGASANLSGNISLGARTSLLEELSAADVQMGKLAQQLGRAILDDAKVRIEASPHTVPGSVATRLRIGDLVETIPDWEADADMVVIGKRGEAADFAKLHLGSNLERIARSCQKPVFVASRAFQPIHRFLIAFDGGPSSLKAVDHIISNPLFTGLECRLLNIGADTPESLSSLAAAQAKLESAGFTVDADILPGQPDLVIADAVNNDNIDLLVMGAYGHSRIRTLIIGSTTAEMLRLCKIPVVLFR